MIRPITCVTFLLACGSGLYLYQTKHKVHVLDAQIDQVVHQTAQVREQTRVLRAEWTLLDQPDRLQQLAAQFLTLQPTKPSQFVSAADLDFRLPAPLPPPSATPAPPPAIDETPAGASVVASVAPPDAAEPAPVADQSRVASGIKPRNGGGNPNAARRGCVAPSRGAPPRSAPSGGAAPGRGRGAAPNTGLPAALSAVLPPTGSARRPARLGSRLWRLHARHGALHQRAPAAHTRPGVGSTGTAEGGMATSARSPSERPPSERAASASHRRTTPGRRGAAHGDGARHRARSAPTRRVGADPHPARDNGGGVLSAVPGGRLQARGRHHRGSAGAASARAQGCRPDRQRQSRRRPGVAPWR